MRHCTFVLSLVVSFVGACVDAEEVDGEIADDPEALVAGDEVDFAAEPDLGPEPATAIAAPAQFKHPGVLVNQGQLEFVRGKVEAGKQPWKGAFDKMVDSEYGQLSWTPKPRKVVNCGPSSNPNEGCSDERRDALASYTHALLWSMTGDSAHAKKAIAILDAWAKKIEKHTGHNAPLQTGWAGCLFPAAAEIIKHTYTGWSTASRNRVRDMLRDVYLPVVRKGKASSNGNWELIMTEATINIAVFLDDKAAFDQAVKLWRRRVPAYIYLTSDGPYPKAATSVHNTPAKLIKYWHDQEVFKDGLAQETCRDFGHTQWGIAAAIGAAETAYQQGVDLYNEQSKRLRKGLEFHHDYILGKPAPSWLCDGDLSLSSIPTGEIAYNHFKNRKQKSLPLTDRFVREELRPRGDLTNYFIAWETLTHAGIGNTGL
jgi:hypothetical protein